MSVDRDEQTSTDSQERIARDDAASKGWEIVAVEVDKGRSAFEDAPRRPALEAAMRLLRAGPADTSIVRKLDCLVSSGARLGRWCGATGP